MAPVSNRFAKYIVQPEQEVGGSSPAPKANRFAKYKQPESEVAAKPKLQVVPQSSYDEMATTPQRSVADTAPQWSAEAPIMGGRTIQDEGREALQSASTKLRVKTPGAVETNRHDSADPDLLGGIGDLLKTANFSVRDWWKHSTAKEKENLIASIPIEATGTGAIARLSDHIGQKTGNDFLVDKTGNFKTDASYDPVAELEMYALNAGSWSTRNQLGGVINPRAVTRSTVGPQLPGVRQALASPTLKEVLPHAADVATNMTMGGSDVATAAARGGVNLAKDVGNALRAGPAATPPPAPVTAAAANPSVAQPAPTAVPPAQPRPAGAGQQPNAGNAAPGGAAPAPAAAAQPVLNATPQRVPAPSGLSKEDVAVMRDTLKATRRLMLGARVPRDVVNDYIGGLFGRYDAVNSGRYPLEFFIEDDLPQFLQSKGYSPEQARNLSGDAVDKIRGWGRERHTSNASGDSSRYTMQDTIHQLTTSQKDELEGTFKSVLGDESLTGREDEIRALMKRNGEEAYTNSIAEANRLIRGGTASKDQVKAAKELNALMATPAYKELLPESWSIQATTAGKTVDELLAARIAQDPIATAHWLQSEIGAAERAARNVDGSPTNVSRAYEARRDALLERLEAFPGYRGSRMQHGDLGGSEDAITAGDRFLTVAKSERQTDLLARRINRMSPRQQEVAALSIRDALLNPLIRLSPEDAAARITQLQNEGTLRALVTVLGPERGDALRNAIADMRIENQRIAALSQGAGSNTHLNTQNAKNAVDNVRGPLNKAVHAVGNPGGWAVAIGADLALGTHGAITGAKAVGSIVDRLSTPGRRFQSRATKGLYGLPQADRQSNALAALPTPTDVPPTSTPPMSFGGSQANALAPPKSPRAPKPPVTADEWKSRIQKDQDELQRLLRQYDQIDRNSPDVDDAMRANLHKQQLARRRIADKTKKLQATQEVPAATPNALATPPRPPVKAGFGGTSKPLPMDEASVKARAKEQGFDVEFPVYHGSRNGGGFDEFQTSERGRFGPGVYFSEQPTVAGKYGEAKPYVVPTTDQLFDAMPRWNSLTSDAEQRIIKQLRPHEKEKLLARKDWYKREGEAFWEALRRAVDGEDGVLADARASEVIQAAGFKGIRGIGDGQETVIFDPKNIRKTDATFDPAESGSSKLLAGMGAAPEGVGAAAGGIGGGIYGATAPLEDANKDGVIDASDRQAMIAQYGLGGVVSGGLAVKGARMGGGAFGNALKRSSAPPALETSGPPKIVRPELKLTERVDTPKRASAPATPGKTAVPLNRPITIISGKSDTGKGYTVTAEAYNDRGRMVLSPEWPTNAFDDLDAAKLKRAEELLYPQAPKPTLVDENYGKPPAPKPAWEVENPKASAEIDKKVADRFVGLMNADPSPAHVLALREGVGLQTIGDIIERGLPKGKQIWIAKDGGEIAVVDKAWHRQNPQEYPIELWNRMWPGSVTREGRRYGWKDGRPTIFAGDVAKPTQAGFLPSGSGKLGAKPPANALAGPPKKPNEMRNSLVRAAAGGVIGGAAGSLAGDAEAQNSETTAQIQRSREERQTALGILADIEAEQKFFATASETELQKRLDREGFDLGPTGADGTIGPRSREAIKGRKAELEKKFSAARARLADADASLKKWEQQAASEKTRPSDVQKAMREWGPLLGALAGVGLGTKLRSGAVSKAAKQAPAQIAKANALLTPGPLDKGRSAATQARLKQQPANLNEFWQMGGAKTSVPFELQSNGKWKPRKKSDVTAPTKLYPNKRIRSMDVGVVAGALAESAGAQWAAWGLEGQIKEARALAEKDPTEANLARVESLEDQHAIAVLLSRLGVGIAGGRLIGALKMPYASARPDVAAADAERALLLEHLKKVK